MPNAITFGKNALYAFPIPFVAKYLVDFQARNRSRRPGLQERRRGCLSRCFSYELRPDPSQHRVGLRSGGCQRLPAARLRVCRSFLCSRWAQQSNTSQHAHRKQRDEDGEPAAGGRDSAGRRPRDGRECFRKCRDARRSVPAPELASLGLGAEPQLNCRSGHRGNEDADGRDKRLVG